MKTARALPLLLLSVTPAWAQITLNTLPTRVIGQNSVQVTSFSPNLVEGREFFNPLGIALDTSTSPPALYVSDTGNNRVLGFRSATGFANGQHADIVIGQVDFVSTFPQGPGHTVSTGFSSPTGLAVDAHGNLYVVDSANNRILRFPQPFAQTGQVLPDLAIGQTAFSAGSINQGGSASATSLALTTTASVLESFITFDSAGNLWVADPGNNRVLRFNASVLGSQAQSGPAADLVLGQPDLSASAYNPPGNADPSTSLTAFTTPTGIAFDSGGRLFVEEAIASRRGRLLVYNPPFFTNQAASRLLGVDASVPQPPAVSAFQLNGSPGGIFPLGDSIGVVDTNNNRILVFPPVAQWTAGATFQAAVEVAGQADFISGTSNRAQPTASGNSLSAPASALFFGNELYVVDSGNHRLLVMPQNGTAFGPATRVLGQDGFNLRSANLVEGREFNFLPGASSGHADAGMAVDLNSSPPHLYVADTYNNRILGFNDLRNLRAGGKADIVIGQPDFQQTLANYPDNSATKTSASGLFTPIGLVVDSDGNLYVADTGNSRVLRFPRPFANYVPGTAQAADLVLGQSSFVTSKITDATARSMSAPYGLALTTVPGLLVSDAVLNRVLYFRGASTDLRSGMSAALVFGQPDFTSGGAGPGLGQLNSPRHISVDREDRLYVADTGNARISIWNTVPSALAGTPAAQTLTKGLSSPRGMYVSPTTNDIWVGDAGVGQAIRYPPYNQLEINDFTPNAQIPDAAGPLAVAQDAWGDLFVADAANRVVTYYPDLGATNAATFLYPNVAAPGMIASLFSKGNDKQFGGQASSAPANQFPLPTQLNGVQVLFNGAPVPLFYADQNQVNFQVPSGAQQNGTADLQVLETATGRILGDTTILLTSVDPGVFTLTGNGIGTAAAINQDGTINGPTNPAVQGDVIVIYGTGQGVVPGAPADGYPATAVQGPNKPEVFLGSAILTPDAIQYSGLAPTLVGVWQLNVVIPKDTITLPTNPTYLFIQQNSVRSGTPATGRAVQIYVKARK